VDMILIHGEDGVPRFGSNYTLVYRSVNGLTKAESMDGLRKQQAGR
jgi:hypothetical protein